MPVVRVEELPVKESSVKFFRYRVEGLPQDSKIFGGERVGALSALYHSIEESGATEILDMHPDAAVNEQLQNYAAEHGVSYRKSQ